MQKFIIPGSPAADSYRYLIAGMEVISNCASNLPQKGFADLQIHVEFTEKYAEKSPCYTSPEWCEVPGMLSPKIRLHTGGDKAVVLQGGLGQEFCAIAIRRLVPFASALQGEVMLHASAVTINSQVVCFIAESGSGKSTLAGALRDIGYPFISDDLLPIRSSNGITMIPHLDGNSVSMFNISMICFLSRDAALGNPEIKIITPKECLRLLLYNGFGEMKDETIWKRQFETYASLATRVKACRLTIPDDLSLLEKTASEIGSHFETLTGVDC